MKNIQHKLFFEQQPNEVWEYLTRSELMELWLMKNDFQPIVGHQFQFKTPPMPQIDFDGVVYCTVLEVVNNKKLSYSWRCGPGDGTINLDSVVVWTLEEINNGTEVYLRHDGFKETENYTIRTLMDAGWLGNMQKIKVQMNKAKHD